jgi:hypothetical protein
VKRDSVIIEPVRNDAPMQPHSSPDDELWRVIPTSGQGEVCVVAGKRAAVDLALTRLNGTTGDLYIRPEPDADPEPFNPAGA